jgi:hypothetical protein
VVSIFQATSYSAFTARESSVSSVRERLLRWVKAWKPVLSAFSPGLAVPALM